ncbi:aldo/keto reductase [Salinibacterium sp. G-O1]|uniref:aldo/keto reductase n=1 Tax=Salinibacterium sp. G-O1 TaxID=3046208 RepID=UPI0024BAFAAE|nr:aldo/keto reductase [Salinibacterium sp. G-O1]MDJ0334690.1 aldo/keto reductase [Salinibacterium sp. G-O1]
MAAIEFRALGLNGPQVSTIGLGCNNFGRTGTATEGQKGTDALISEAVELGVTLLDTADMYGGAPGVSETLMGVALKGKRDSVFLATKFGHDSFDMGIAPGERKGSRAYIREALDGSLRRLQTDRVDLYQMHTPDPHTPIEETIAALDELVDEGRVIHYGHSNFTANQIDAAASAGGRFVSAQNEYSLLARGIEDDVLPAINRHDLGLLPYFPLQNGLLTGKFTRTERPADSRIMRQRPHIADNAPWDALEAYDAFCVATGISMLEATFGWLLAQPGLSSVIAGTTRPEQLRQNASAATAWVPSAAQVAEISAIFA